MRLHVGIVGTEQRTGPLNGQAFHHIDVLTAAVVALARIAFSVFVGELGALGLHHRAAGIVLRCNQLDVSFLTSIFAGNGSGNLGIVIAKLSSIHCLLLVVCCHFNQWHLDNCRAQLWRGFHTS